MSKKLFIKTYGCQMNVYDSEKMADVLSQKGYEAVDTASDADLVILNTCHIREKAAEKVYSDVGRLRQLKEARAAKDGSDQMTIAVAGCVAQAEGAEMMRRAPVIDMVVGPQAYHRLPELTEKAKQARSEGRRPRLLETDFPVESKFDHLPKAGAVTEAGVQKRKNPSAFLTVQEGCDKFCTFCVVPYTRGGEFSRPLSALLEEAQGLALAGVREVTLLGQNVNAYHGAQADGTEIGLGELMREIAKIEGLERIRYTTSHPRDMTQELIETHRDLAECMPYLHLPVQSGSDRILEAMNRRHTRDIYFEIIEKLRQARPDIALSGDFIVGFPGETDADFADTMDLVERVGYAQAYSFKYSPRPGTPAADIKDQVPEDVKAARLQALQALLNKQQLAFNEASVGRTVDVLLERAGKEAGQLVGRSPYLQAVHVMPGSGTAAPHKTMPHKTMMGKLVPVKIISAGPNSLEGEIVGDSK